MRPCHIPAQKGPHLRPHTTSGAKGATLCPHAMPCPKGKQPCRVPCRAPTPRRRAASQRKGVPPTIPSEGTSVCHVPAIYPRADTAGSRPQAGPWEPGRPPRPPREAPRTHLARRAGPRARDASTRGRRRRRGRARASREAGGGRWRGERAGRRPGAGRGEGIERPPRTARGESGPAPPRVLGYPSRVGVPGVGSESGTCPRGAQAAQTGMALGCLANPREFCSSECIPVPGRCPRACSASPSCPGMLSCSVSPSQVPAMC